LTAIEQFNVHFFFKEGGMKQMGEDLDRRMVFVISTRSMNWFDSALQGDMFALADTIKTDNICGVD